MSVHITQYAHEHASTHIRTRKVPPLHGKHGEMKTCLRLLRPPMQILDARVSSQTYLMHRSRAEASFFFAHSDILECSLSASPFHSENASAYIIGVPDMHNLIPVAHMPILALDCSCAVLKSHVQMLLHML